MNFEPNRQSRLIRCAFAAAAVAATLTLSAFIDGLAKHYSAESVQTAQKTTVMAKR